MAIQRRRLLDLTDLSPAEVAVARRKAQWLEAAIRSYFGLATGAIVARQAMKAIEDVVGVADGDGDLALEAIAIGGRHGGVAVEIALAGRQVLGLLVGGRLVGAVGHKRQPANKAAQQGAAAGDGRLGRQQCWRGR